MKLTQPELDQLRNRGIHLTEKCDECLKVLNQAHCYTFPGSGLTLCSDDCWQLVYEKRKIQQRRSKREPKIGHAKK